VYIYKSPQMYILKFFTFVRYKSLVTFIFIWSIYCILNAMQNKIRDSCKHFLLGCYSILKYNILKQWEIFIIVDCICTTRNPKLITDFLNVCCVLLFCVFLCCSVFFVLYGPLCHGALRFDMSILFTTFFLWTSPSLSSNLY